MIKRLFDFVVSLMGLVVLSPLLAISGFLIKLLMPGPIFFIQKRIGREYKAFRLLKFRTMTVKLKSSEGSYDIGDNSRITALGKILRRTKIDEIPQLINVLKGDMSLVGPRPEVEKWVAVYPKRWEKVLSVKPGITDNASILYRNEELILAESENPEKVYKEIILPKKLDLYEDYVENNSFFGDLSLIFKTLYYVILK